MRSSDNNRRRSTRNIVKQRLLWRLLPSWPRPMPKLQHEGQPLQEQGPQNLVVGVMIDQGGVVITHLVREMEFDRTLPQPKGSTLEPPPEVTDRVVRRLHLVRSKIELLEIRGLHNSKMGMVVMRLIVITPTSQRIKKTTTHKEEKTARDVPKSLHCTPASSVVGESKSRVVSHLKN